MRSFRRATPSPRQCGPADGIGGSSRLGRAGCAVPHAPAATAAERLVTSILRLAARHFALAQAGEAADDSEVGCLPPAGSSSKDRAS